MERHRRPLTKIMPPEYPTLRECVIASFQANGPMTNRELFRSLPRFNEGHIEKIVMSLSDKLTGR